MCHYQRPDSLRYTLVPLDLHWGSDQGGIEFLEANTRLHNPHTHFTGGRGGGSGGEVKVGTVHLIYMRNYGRHVNNYSEVVEVVVTAWHKVVVEW
ncbi:hypothetical protein E2C01_071779 [Portunus trituberculatus]|uniref:Uncharacterized protein n=1 Tax=Portunus trituberculatus TaxID=210409 RepID=A0A5B7I760_PORTR|nr:hypothetical protein [Portunus trituberculatus]